MAVKEPPVIPIIEAQALWQLNIIELTARNLERDGRDMVNDLLKAGWLLLYIYTLKYKEDDVWRERPMAILGRPGPPSRAGGSPKRRPRPAN